MCSTHEPGIGVHLGLQTRATLWGNVGFATLSAPSMRAAIELAVRFCDVVTPAIGLRLREEADVAELISTSTSTSALRATPSCSGCFWGSGTWVG